MAVSNGFGRKAGIAAGIGLIALTLQTGTALAAPGSDGWRAERHRAGKRHQRAPRVEAETRIPAGQLQLVVSIARQRAMLFADGKPAGEAPVSTGVPGHPTPMGVFAVIGKSRHHASNLYSGAPMPYMHRITWSGVALHEGMLPGYPASHGCIRLPGSFVSKLFAASKLGMRVVVTRDPAAPAEIESPRLFVPRQPPEAVASNVPEVQRLVEIAAAKMTAGETKTDAATDLSASRSKPGEPATGAVKIADASLTIKAPADIIQPEIGAPKIADPAKPQEIKSDAAKPEAAKPEEPRRKGPVQVFVSRKEGKVYVRQGFAPLFDAPVAIPDPAKPWGTHVFTAMDIADGKVRWTVLTIPSGFAAKADLDHRGRKLSAKEIERREKRAFDLANAPPAADALALFELPKDAVERIEVRLAPGSSLIVSDNALSDETGVETDFIVATQ